MPESTLRTSTDGAARAETVPLWLATLVIALALGVLVAGIFVVRSLAEGPPRAIGAAQDVELRRLEREAGASADGVRAQLELGAAYQRAGRPDDALKAYSAVLSAEPTNTAALYNSAIALLGRGEYEEAERRLRAVLKQDPGHILAAQALARQLDDAGRPREVIKVLEPTLRANPEFADIQILAARANESLGKPAEAARRYRLALVYSPENSVARAGLERVRRESK